MNHDITHCSGTDITFSNDKQRFVEGKVICDRRDTCHRYIAYLDLFNIEDSVLVSMNLSPKNCIDNSYDMYLKETKINK